MYSKGVILDLFFMRTLYLDSYKYKNNEDLLKVFVGGLIHSTLKCHGYELCEFQTFGSVSF